LGAYSHYGLGSLKPRPENTLEPIIYMGLITVIKLWHIGPVENKRMISGELGSQLEAYVAELVKSGRYHSKSEVLREGVRLVQEREARLAALDASLARGTADANAGRVKPAAEVFDRLEAKYQGQAKDKGR
jgi:antitoxin ParD1/3/4